MPGAPAILPDMAHTAAGFTIPRAAGGGLLLAPCSHVFPLPRTPPAGDRLVPHRKAVTDDVSLASGPSGRLNKRVPGRPLPDLDALDIGGGGGAHDARDVRDCSSRRAAQGHSDLPALVDHGYGDDGYANMLALKVKSGGGDYHADVPAFGRGVTEPTAVTARRLNAWRVRWKPRTPDHRPYCHKPGGRFSR